MEESDIVKEDAAASFFRAVRAQYREEQAVCDSDIVKAMVRISHAYHPENMNSSVPRIPIDYNDKANRCAYLYKYLIHAAALKYFVKTNGNGVSNALNNNKTIKICCLGGGSGTDIVGLSAAFSELDVLSQKPYTFTIIDHMAGWESLCDCVFSVASKMEHGSLSDFLGKLKKGESYRFICNSLSADGNGVSKETIDAIGDADVISLLKFVSALPPNESSAILEKVFSWMKPGALVLFLDNSSGGSYGDAKRAAENNCLKATGFASEYEKYEGEKETFTFEDEYGRKTTKYSTFNLSLTMQMWKKAVMPKKRRRESQLRKSPNASAEWQQDGRTEGESSSCESVPLQMCKKAKLE